MTYVSIRERFLALGCLGDTLLAKCTSHALDLSNLWLQKSGFLKARSHQLVNFFSFLMVKINQPLDFLVSKFQNYF